MSSPSGLLGRVAVAAKVITMEQLSQATSHQADIAPEMNIGDIFVELGFMDRPTLKRVVALQQKILAKAQKKPQAAPATTPPPADAPPAPAPSSPAPPNSAAENGATAVTQATVRRAGVAPAQSGPKAGGALNILHKLLAAAVAKRSSDIHLHSGAPPAFRISGRYQDQYEEPLDRKTCEAMVLAMLTPEQRTIFDEHGQLDFSYSVDGVGRFRTNIYRQLRGIDAVMRAIPPHAPSLSDLGLPTTLARFTGFHQGLLLFTGPTGCGKSSTMAALVNMVNEERSEHILTIEDPIEYLHPSKGCLVNQRNVGPHTESFARALRGALREDPDVIVIGELRDLETISLAMTAAETGHFVLATLHTDNAIRTINRITGAFPHDQQAQVRSMLSESLRAVISQRLLPVSDGEGQVPAAEILVVNRAVGNLIREQKTVQLRSVMQTGAAHGMCLLDQSLARLVHEGKVNYDDAVLQAENPKEIVKP
jgi:twitching motility protein PilT